jgi:hypothetical protein
MFALNLAASSNPTTEACVTLNSVFFMMSLRNEMETLRWRRGHGGMIRSQMQGLAYNNALEALGWLFLLSRVAAHDTPGYLPPAPKIMLVTPPNQLALGLT